MQSGILINGEWQSRSNHIPDINPSDTQDVIEEYSWGIAEDIVAAAGAARQALPAWRDVLPEARAKLLRKIGDEIYARADELAQVMSREQGKTLRESIAEVRRSGEIFHYFAGEAVRNYGVFTQGMRSGFTVTVSKEPLGVVSIITPWNLPMSIPAWKIAPALAYGNTVVFKPSELTPGCAWALADIIHRAGVPAGVFNMVMGNGRELGASLIELTDGVTFTGSNPTGVAVVNMAASRMKKVQAELGGKSGLVIDQRANLDLAVEVAFQGAYHGTGQRCTASSRIIVLESVRDEFFERLIKRMKVAQVGHALEATTEIGPVVDERQLAKNCEYIGIARAEGAELLFGGERLELSKPGFYLQPALFLANDNKMRINQEEVFGPVASALVVKDLDEAIAVSNDVHFALSSGIVTNDLIAAEEFRRRSAAAMVTINAPTAGLDFHVPFGGRAPSGYGSREQGLAAHEFYTEYKSSYTNVSGRI